MSKCRWIFPRFGACVDIVEIWFGIATGQISSIFERVKNVSACNTSTFSFLDHNFSKYQCMFPKLGMCIDIVEICFGIANGQISSIFERVICP